MKEQTKVSGDEYPFPMPKYIMHGKSIQALVDREHCNFIRRRWDSVFNNTSGQLEGLDAVDKDFSRQN